MSKRSVLLVHRAYFVAVFLKGLNGLLEFVAGLIFAIAGPERLYDWVIRVTAPELFRDPDDITAHLFRRWFFDLMHVSKIFVILYLLLHGGIKLAIAFNLLREKSWAFPWGVAILSAFVAYFCFEMLRHFSWLVFALALFDTFTLALVIQEWRNFKTTQGFTAAVED